MKTCCLPSLPRHKELVSELGPLHAMLTSQNSIAKRHPVYKCNEVQVFTNYRILRELHLVWCMLHCIKPQIFFLHESINYYINFSFKKEEKKLYHKEK